MSNAIKFRSPERKLHIELKTTTIDDYICLTIKDNGLGIDMNSSKDKIFMLYQRFHTHIKGKGIGLFMVKTQLDILEGKIEVESEKDKGTTFKVYFKIN